jgi:hypothetical protein
MNVRAETGLLAKLGLAKGRRTAQSRRGRSLKIEAIEARRMFAADLNFSSAVELDVESFRANTVASADLDGDGVEELILGGSRLQVLDGDGVAKTLGSGWVFRIDTGDIDGDGDLDILAAHESHITWYENLGTGEFRSHWLRSGQTARSAALGDIDGDGDLDIAHVAGDEQFPRIYWYENIGAASSTGFSSGRIMWSLLENSDPWDVQIVDIDNDQQNEVVVALHRNPFSGGSVVAFNKAPGSHWSEGWSRVGVANPGFPTRMAIADFDGDNDLDMATTTAFPNSRTPSLYGYENLQTGRFRYYAAGSGTAATYGVAAGDIDGDGDIDLAFTELLGAAKVGWMENDGSGQFTRHNLPGTFTSPRGVTIADANRDGNPDIVVAVYGENRYVVFENPSPSRNLTESIDFDGDGASEVVSHRNGRWYLSTGSGDVRGERQLDDWSGLGQVAEPVVGDFNGDGRTDVAARVNGRWMLGLSNGSSLQRVNWSNWSTAVSWRDIVVGDFNGDGKDDLAGRANGAWWLTVSSGSGYTVEYWTIWSNVVDWKDVRVGDFNGDGRSDIAGRANGAWWLATSNGSQFQNRLGTIWSSAVTWQDVVVGDFNGDGRSDIAGRTSGSWWVAMSTGQQFSNQFWSLWTPGAGWRSIAVGDFNGDGRDDIAGRAGNAWWIALSEGNRARNAYWAAWAGSMSWRELSFGDFDGDGWDDLAGRQGSGWRTARSR